MSAILRTYPTEMPWAIVEIKNQLFAIATQDMREMVMMPETAAVPNVPDYIRGVINLRGRVMPVVDLRKRMGFASALEEAKSFSSMIQQREQDHRNWLNELEASVKQRRPFGLTTDPHKCAFGKWYDTYHADNGWVAALLKKFDAPHQQIHGIAVAVETFKASQAFDKAEQLIAQTRDYPLAQLVKLFAELQDLMKNTGRETAVLLTGENRLFAISVDVAQSIEKFPAGNIEEISPLVPISHNGVVRRLARRAKSKDIILLIETDCLMAGCDMAALPLPDSPASRAA